MDTKCLLAWLATSLPLAAQSAFAIDSQLDRLYSVDLATGAVTQIGSTLNNGLDAPSDLCWRDDTGELFTVDLAGGEVGRFARNASGQLTSTFVSSWNTNISGFQAIAWDARARRFWLHHQNNTLYSLNPATGAVTLVGTTTPANLIITSLEVDAQGRVWALDAMGGILEMDSSNGTVTPRATTTLGMQGLAIDADGVWFAVNATTDSLYRIDPVTGTATLLGAMTGTQLVKGIAIVDTAVQRLGTACADGTGTLRRLAWSGSSAIGNSLALGAETGPVSVGSLVAIGFSNTVVGPLTLPLDLGVFGAPGCRLYTSADAITPPIATGATVSLAIPSLPALVGALLFAQAAILDSSPNANAAGLAFTDAARIVVRS
jgi:hypothetical protein